MDEMYLCVPAFGDAFSDTVPECGTSPNDSEYGELNYPDDLLELLHEISFVILSLFELESSINLSMCETYLSPQNSAEYYAELT